MNRYYIEKLGQIKRDPQQYEAYLSDISTVVIAGPGSGKTTVLTLKVLRLLRENIKEPRGLACVTFSREAVREFKQRLYKLGYSGRTNVFLGTVHSFCIAEVLSPFAHLFKEYNIPMPIRIVSDRDKHKLFKTVVSDLKFDNLGIRIEEMDKERRLNIKGVSKVKIQPYEVALKVAREYERRLHTMGYMDYEDIVNYSTWLIQDEEYVRKCLSAKFPWIVIDEYQDLGRPLHEMILSLFTQTDIKIFAVGDPDQSIYGFQGAIPEYLMELYKSPGIKQVELKTNYRSNQDIINACELVLNAKREYIAGTRLDENADFVFVTCEEEMEQQYEFVVDKIIPYYSNIGVPLEEIAILLGSNSQVKKLSEYFETKSIPYYISRHEFDRSDIVKWLESCASWAIDNLTESFNEIYNFWEQLLIKHNKRIHPDKRILEKRKLYEIIDKNHKYKDRVEKWVKNIISDLNLKNILKDSTVYPDEIENLDNLVKVVERENFRNYNISRFSKLGKPENQVTISTRHSSKGLEFEVVVMLGMEEENFPSYYSLRDKMKLEEEHRVCFVCISRAKKACVLVRSKIHTRNGKNGPWRKAYMESRFWKILMNKYSNRLNEKMFESVE